MIIFYFHKDKLKSQLKVKTYIFFLVCLRLACWIIEYGPNDDLADFWVDFEGIRLNSFFGLRVWHFSCFCSPFCFCDEWALQFLWYFIFGFFVILVLIKKFPLSTKKKKKLVHSFFFLWLVFFLFIFLKNAHSKVFCCLFYYIFSWVFKIENNQDKIQYLH